MGFFSIGGMNFKLSEISFIGKIEAVTYKKENGPVGEEFIFIFVVDGLKLSLSNSIESELVTMRASVLTALGIDEARPNSAVVIPSISGYEKVETQPEESPAH